MTFRDELKSLSPIGENGVPDPLTAPISAYRYAHADTDAEGDNADVDRWLVEFLADAPVKASEVYSAADAAGFSKDKAKRAKKRLDITAVKVGNGPWLWSLDGKGADSDPSINDRSLAPLLPSQVSEGNQGCTREQESKSAAEIDTGNGCTLTDEAVQP